MAQSRQNRISDFLSLAGLLLVLIGIFLFPMYLKIWLGLRLYTSRNYLAMAGCLLLLAGQISQGGFFRRDRLTKLLIAAMLLLFWYTQYYHASAPHYTLTAWIGLFPPLILLFSQPARLKTAVRLTLFAFNCVALVSFLWGVIDYFCQDAATSAFWSQVNHHMAIYALYGGRLFTYMGHTLFSALLFPITFGLNFLYDHYILHSHWRELVILPICLVGVAMTASKAAFVVIVLMIGGLYLYRLRYLLLVVGGFLLALQSGVFQSTIQRFLEASLTTGRNEMWNQLMEADILQFHLLYGYGAHSKYSFEALIQNAKAAFEYPVLLFSLEYGILFMLLFMAVCFLIPAVKLLRGSIVKNYFALVVLIGVAAQANTWNGIGNYDDVLYAFCLFIFCLLSIVRLRDQSEITVPKPPSQRSWLASQFHRLRSN